METCGQALLVNRVMCNIAEHVRKVAAQVEALYGSTMVVKYIKMERKQVPAITAKTFTATGTRNATSNGWGGADDSAHKSHDMEQARLNGMSNIRVVKVRFPTLCWTIVPASCVVPVHVLVL